MAEYGADVSIVAGEAPAAAFSTKIALKNPVGGCCQNLSGLGNTVLCPFVHLCLEVFAEIVRLKDEPLALEPFQLTQCCSIQRYLEPMRCQCRRFSRPRGLVVDDSQHSIIDSIDAVHDTCERDAVNLSVDEVLHIDHLLPRGLENREECRKHAQGLTSFPIFISGVGISLRQPVLVLTSGRALTVGEGRTDQETGPSLDGLLLPGFIAQSTEEDGLGRRLAGTESSASR